MKLFIRSQDRNKLMEAEELIIKEVVKTDANNVNGYKQEVVGCNVLVGDIVVALYKTKERALQVLDEIQNALVGKVIVETKAMIKQKDKEALKEMVEEKTIVKSPAVDIKTLNQNCVVYELPRE